LAALLAAAPLPAPAAAAATSGWCNSA
jgi:hypothetical protein